MSKDLMPEGTVHTTYYHMQCPFCDEYCFVNVGDLMDMTAVDIEAVTCAYCQKVFLMPGSQENREAAGDNPAYSVDDLSEDPMPSHTTLP